ncbi:MAG TPA: hypothetical protein VLJ58_16845, partial [Ramlibacter sp.]|nr:hypothetical protein [Ramlibacter sp.]
PTVLQMSATSAIAASVEAVKTGVADPAVATVKPEEGAAGGAAEAVTQPLGKTEPADQVSTGGTPVSNADGAKPDAERKPGSSRSGKSSSSSKPKRKEQKPPYAMIGAAAVAAAVLVGWFAMGRTGDRQGPVTGALPAASAPTSQPQAGVVLTAGAPAVMPGGAASAAVTSQPASAASAAASAAAKPASAAASAARAAASAARAKRAASAPTALNAPTTITQLPPPVVTKPELPRQEARPAASAVTPQQVQQRLANPEEICKDKGLFDKQFCIHEQCAKPALQNYPVCVRVRENRQREASRP